MSKREWRQEEGKKFISFIVDGKELGGCFPSDEKWWGSIDDMLFKAPSRGLETCKKDIVKWLMKGNYLKVERNA